MQQSHEAHCLAYDTNKLTGYWMRKKGQKVFSKAVDWYFRHKVAQTNRGGFLDHGLALGVFVFVCQTLGIIGSLWHWSIFRVQGACGHCGDACQRSYA